MGFWDREKRRKLAAHRASDQQQAKRTAVASSGPERATVPERGRTVDIATASLNKAASTAPGASLAAGYRGRCVRNENGLRPLAAARLRLRAVRNGWIKPTADFKWPMQ